MFFLVLIFLLGLLLWFKFADRDVTLFLAQYTKNRTELADKVVWITGASQGLGLLLANLFYKRGAKLILSSRNQEKLKLAADKIGSSDRIHVLPFDLMSSDWDRIAQEALSSFPEGIDYIIHNAGISQHSVASETKAKIVDDIFSVNATGHISLTQALLPGLLKQKKGHFTVISSMAGKVPSPGQAIYSGAKHAVMGYFQTLRSELADCPVGVTICCPGPFKFGSGSSTRQVYHTQGIVREEVKKERGLDAAEVAELIVFATECKLSECWMAKQPVLMMAYLMQYCPTIAAWILDYIGPKRAAAVKKGDGYSIKKMFN